MARRGMADTAVGTLFALALVILALGVMAIGGESRVFSSKATYRLEFSNADGLTVGSPVKMAGVQVGSVTRITLPTDAGMGGIEVLAGVDRAYSGLVREDSRGRLRVLMYLSGEKFVEITPGSSTAAPLAPGAAVPADVTKELFEQSEDIADNLSGITVSLSNILSSLERGEGLIGQMLKDPGFGKDGLEALRGTLENARSLTGDLLHNRGADFNGQGVLGRILYDEKLAKQLDALGDAAESMKSVAGALERREGLVGELLAEDGSGKRAAVDLAESAAALKRVTARLERSEGLVGRLLQDDAYGEALAQSLLNAVQRLESVLTKIDSGEGSIGTLINDNSLVDAAHEIVNGANESRFSRWLLRHYRKKGLKAEANTDDDEAVGTEERP